MTTDKEREIEAENERLRSALKVVAIPEGNRAKYYSIEQYMRHVDGCTYETNEVCKCGLLAIAFNADSLLGACEAAALVLEGDTLDEADQKVIARRA
jgi:hypothetical protein